MPVQRGHKRFTTYRVPPPSFSPLVVQHLHVAALITNIVLFSSQRGLQQSCSQQDISLCGSSV